MFNKRVTLTALGLVLIAAGLIIVDLTRSPCHQLSRMVASRLLEPFAEDLAFDLRGITEPAPLRAFRVDKPFAVVVPDGREIPEWVDLQGGILTVLPSQGVVILSPPSWKTDEESFYRRFMEGNPGAQPLSDGGKQQVEPLLVLQTGGGVEGLDEQVVLQKSGWLELWRREGRMTDATLQLVRTAKLAPDLTSRLFYLSERSRLAERSFVAWHCGVLDGAAMSLHMLDGSSVGRAHYINIRYPRGPLADLAEELLLLAGHGDLP